MHPVLEDIYTKGEVTDGTQRYSALNERGQPTFMDATEGAMLQRIIAEVRPTTTLEVGMAYGVSTLFICEALAKLSWPTTHIVMDPFQTGKWRGIGLHNVRSAGFQDKVRFYEERSEFCLPRLLWEGTEVQVALIDGAHIFEQCALEFYYIDRMLPVGGVIILDDVNWAPVRRVARLVMSYGTYEVAHHTGRGSDRKTLAGRARRALTRPALVRRLLRHDLVVRDWDLGIAGSCVALRKISPARREHGDYRDF